VGQSSARSSDDGFQRYPAVNVCASGVDRAADHRLLPTFVHHAKAVDTGLNWADVLERPRHSEPQGHGLEYRHIDTVPPYGTVHRATLTSGPTHRLGRLGEIIGKELGLLDLNEGGTEPASHKPPSKQGPDRIGSPAHKADKRSQIE
jgi:hypothetical protein